MNYQNNYGGLTEELRDEKINQNLLSAYDLKNQQEYEKALSLYLTVLGQEFIKNSLLEQHIKIRQNAHVNAGEIYELIGNYNLAKDHYTKALRIKENDPWVWSKIAQIEYRHQGNLKIAQKCYEASINTQPTLIKRSAYICPILVQLCEINFKLSNFEKCEEIVDSIILRSRAPNIDQYSKNFAFKLKAFFHATRGETDQKSRLLNQACIMIDQNSQKEDNGYHDLEIIKDFYNKMHDSFQRHGSNGVPIWNEHEQIHKFIQVKGLLNLQEIDKKFNIQILELKNIDFLSQNYTLSQLFDDFLNQLATQIEGLKENSKDLKILQNMVIDTSFYQNLIEILRINFIDEAQQLKFEEIVILPSENDQYQRNVDKQEYEIQEKSKIQNAQNQSNVLLKNDSISKNSSSVQPAQKRIGLRKKMDFTEQQLSLINLKQLDNFKDYIINEFKLSFLKKQSNQSVQYNEDSNHEQSLNEMLEFVYSQKELLQCKKLVENKKLFQNSVIQNDRNDFNKNKTTSDKNHMTITLDQYQLLSFQRLLHQIDGRRIPTIIRQILIFIFDHENKFANRNNSVNIYKLFQNLMIFEGPFSQSWLEKKKQAWHFYSSGSTQSASTIQKNDFLNFSGNSPLLLISVFELSLFNKLVIKEIKSGTIMEYIQVHFDYFSANEQLFQRQIDEYYERKLKRDKYNQDDSNMDCDNDNIENILAQMNSLQLKIRFMFAMMYCAFEIRNDMNHSVVLYSKLQNLISIFKLQEFDKKLQIQDQDEGTGYSQIRVHLPHIDAFYFLDNQKMAEFGDLKIKQARTFKDFDSGLMKLKQREHRQQQLQQIENQQNNVLTKQNLLQNKKDNQLSQAQKKLESTVIQDEADIKIDEKEFDKYASFYLDQFFIYLNASVSVQSQQVHSFNNQSQNKGNLEEKQGQITNASSQIQNEEKVKEMWQQLVYSLCRASTPLLLKAAQNIFCVFTVINYLNKNFYEQFILKKLDFQKIIYRINQRLSEVYHQIEHELHLNQDQDIELISICQIKENVLIKIGKMLGIELESDDNENHDILTKKIEAQLVKLQITLLRQFTPEFYHYNIFLTHSSNTAFLNMMSNAGIQNLNSQLGPSHANTHNNLNIISNMALNSRSQFKHNQQQFNTYPTMLVDLFPQILYHLEFFKCILNGDPQKDNSHNIKSILRLFIHLDKLTTQNEEKKEMFCKAYTQLIVYSFPVIAKCLQIDIERVKLNNQFNQLIQSNQIFSNDISQIQPQFFKKLDQQMSMIYNLQVKPLLQTTGQQKINLSNFQLPSIQLNSKNGLVQFITQALKFFFEMKFNLRLLDLSQKAQMNENHNAFDDKKDFMEKDLDGDVFMSEDLNNKMKQKEENEMEDDGEDDEDELQDEFDEQEELFYSKWVHLTSIFSQFKREKSSKNWKDSQNSGALFGKSPMLQYFINNCPLDISLFSDLIQIICFFTENKPLKKGELSLKEIKNLQFFNDILVDFISTQLPKINEQLLNSELGANIQKKLKDLNKISHEFNPKQFEIDLQGIFDQYKNGGNDNQQKSEFKQCKELKLVLDYIVNYTSSILLQWAPFQNSRFDITFKIGSNQQSTLQSNQGAEMQKSISNSNQSVNQNTVQSIAYINYFAFIKKGGTQGCNTSVQISKIHENLINAMSNQKEISFDLEEPSANEMNHVSLQVSSQNQFLSLKNQLTQAFRLMSRLIKMDIKLIPQYYLKISELNPNAFQSNDFQQIQNKIDNLRFLEVLFNQTFMQSLIYFQQYSNSQNQSLFINKNKENQPLNKQQSNQNLSEIQLLIQDPAKKISSSEKLIQQRYFQSSIQNSMFALRFLIQKQNIITYMTQNEDSQQIQQMQINSDCNKRQINEQFIQILELQKELQDNFQTFFQLCKMVLDHILTIQVFRIKSLKSKQYLQDQYCSDNSNSKQEKILQIQNVCQVLSIIGDFIDVFSTPSRDPRINNKFKKNQIHNHLIEIMQILLQQFDESTKNENSQMKTLFSNDKVQNIQQNLQQIFHQCNFESRKNEQRLNLNFTYAYLQGKFLQKSIENQQKDEIKLYINKIMYFKRSLEIAQVNRQINGVLESVKKLIQYSFRIALNLKYKKSTLSGNLQELQNVIQNIVKPVIQDQELKRFIVKALSQSQQGKNNDFDLQDEFQDISKSHDKSNNVGVDDKNTSFQHLEDSVVDNETNAIKVRQNLLLKDYKIKNSQDDLMITIDSQASLREENDLIQIYKFSDFICNNLNNVNKQFLKVRFQLMNAKNLLREIEEHENQNDQKVKNEKKIKVSPEKLKILVEMLKPLIFQFCLSYEDNWNGIIYEEFEKKNLITSIAHQELTGIACLRIKFIKFFIQLCIQSLDYEPIKEIYKRQSIIIKLQDQSNSTLAQAGASHLQPQNIQLYSVKILFDLSLNEYVNVLCNHICDQLEKYIEIRKQLAQSTVKQGKQSSEPENKWKAKSAKTSFGAYLEIRQKIQVSKDHTPQILKEIFELFIDANSKKGYLSSRKLLNDQQKSLIIQSVLNCCAFCGPDNLQLSENISEDKNLQQKQVSKLQSIKFVDIAKISTPEYQIEGLKICVQWYCDVLEKQQPKTKNQDLIKKLKTTLEEVLLGLKK